MSNTRKATMKAEGIEDDAPEAKSPLQAEAQGDEMVNVEFDGREFTFLLDSFKWSVGARRAFRRGDHEEGLARLLGDQYVLAHIDEWDGYKAVDLFMACAAAAGLQAVSGE